MAKMVLHLELCTQSEIVELFLREGYLANRVGHQGVVAVLDDDRTADGLAHPVMDLLDGHTLADALESRWTLTWGDALRIVDRVRDVLVAAHAQGIVHRDRKSENVFLRRDGGV